MSRQVRNRVTATVLGGLLLGAGLVTTGTANAGQVAGGGRQVVFTGGGVLGLSCSSTPSVESMRVPAEGRVRLVNRTGQGARLRLDGESRGTIPDDGSTEVVFRRGTTSVTLDPTCAVADPATPVLVTASPVVTSRPDPIPPPPLTTPDLFEPPAEPGEPAEPTPPADTGSALPEPPVAERPTRSAPAAGPPVRVRPGTSRATRVAAEPATAAVRERPRGGAAPRVRTKTRVRGTPGAAAPASPGVRPSIRKKARHDVPKPALSAPATTAAPESPAGVAPGAVAAEPVAALRPMPESRPVGLLAVIALVCVLGVSIGVIRALVSQRAYRASVA